MPRGLPKAYIEKYGITKAAWAAYRSDKAQGKRRTDKVYPGPKQKVNRVSSTGNSGGSRTVKKHRKPRQFTIPLAVVGGLAAGMSLPVQYALNGDFPGAMENLVSNYTGYSMMQKKWEMWRLQAGIAPLIIGVLVHKGASLLGVNRALGRARVPIIRI